MKRSLRLWFEKEVKRRDIGNEADYLYKGFPSLRLEELIRADSLEGIARILSNTPYGKIIGEAANRDISRLGLFPVEAALDAYFFSTLIATMRDLSDADRTVARKLIGVEIDLENLERIVRFKELYGITDERLGGFLIPAGKKLKPRDLTGDSNDIVESYVSGNYSRLTPLLQTRGKERYSNLVLLETLLNEILSTEVRYALSGYPFSMGIILAYYFLKRREVRQVILILNAKAYGIDEERVRSLL